MPSKIVRLPSGNVRMTTIPDGAGGLLQSILTIPSKEMTDLVANQIIGRSPLAANELGLFTMKGGVTTDKYAIAMLQRAKHLWSSRKDGCQFVPKGKIASQRAEFELNPIEYDGKQCPDEFFGSEWETLFATGDPFEMLSSANGAFALDAIVKVIIDSLQEDFWNLLLMGSNPIITTAETNGTYTVSEAEWADFKDQMKNVGGFITAADFLKAAGRDNYNVGIDPADVNGEDFIGDVTDGIFKDVRSAHTPLMRTYSKNRRYGKTLWLCSRGIFNKYKDELIERFNGILTGYTLQTTGVDGTMYAMEDVLLWDGNVILCFDELAEVDTITGYTTHMIMAIVPGNIPIIYNANTARGSKNIGTDFGLKLQQSMDIKEKGNVYMTANIKVGTGIINPDLVTYAVLRVATDAS
jgi:hypothetical protein